MDRYKTESGVNQEPIIILNRTRGQAAQTPDALGPVAGMKTTYELASVICSVLQFLLDGNIISRHLS
jgi:hypothetical protein